MIFNLETQRKYPQAGLIPLLQWQSLFENEDLPELYIELMQTNDANLLTRLQAKDVLDLCVNRADKQRLWVAIAYAHPNLNEAQLQEIATTLSMSNNLLLRTTVLIGHPRFFEALVAPQFASKDFQNFSIFLWDTAVEYGHVAILDRLLELAPYKMQKMLDNKAKEAFRWAGMNGHVAMINRLVELVTAKTQWRIVDLLYEAFQRAAMNGQLPMINRLVELLEELSPYKVHEMIASSQYAALDWAASYGYLPIVNRLVELAPDKAQEMIAFGEYRVLRTMPATEIHRPIINYLFSVSSSAFAYAEGHMQEDNRKYYVSPFVREALVALKTSKAAYPNKVFDLADEEETKRCFYILRYLIRCNLPQLRDDMVFLLNIPAVSALVHLDVTRWRPNELLRLALACGNQIALSLLLTIPAVLQLAEENNFYAQEVGAGIDVNLLTQESQSSMRALTQGKQRRQEGVIALYQPLAQFGVFAAMQADPSSAAVSTQIQDITGYHEHQGFS